MHKVNLEMSSYMTIYVKCTYTYACLYFNIIPVGFVCYDDGCHLKKYASHNDRKKLTPTATRLSSAVTILVDKMHFRGHTDKWCQENCNPYKYDELKDVGVITFNIPHIVYNIVFYL